MNCVVALRQISDLARQMAESASLGKWDELCELEARQRHLLEELASHGISLSKFGRHPELAAEIASILKAHEIVAAHVQPWMEHIQPLLKALAANGE